MASKKPRLESAAPFLVAEELVLTVDRLAFHSGFGVGRVNGIVVFVPFTAPDEKVRARVVEIHKTYVVAELLEILRRSPHRRDPPCPVAGICGGCAWQQVTYEEQLRQKQELLEEHLRHLTKSQEFSIFPLVAAPDEFRYRNRVQFHRLGREVGFYALGSNRLVAIDDCLLAEPEVAGQISKIRARADSPDAPREERIEVTRGNLGLSIEPAPGETVAGRFAQVNSRQNEVLLNIVREAISESAATVALDLYCGSGNFTFALAEALPKAQIIGVELSPHLIAEAKQKASGHSAQTRLKWHEQSSGSFVEKWRNPPNFIMVLDPPRSGCDRQTRQGIGRLQPDQIVYVSCNPMTLARDVETWCRDGRYAIEFVRGVDMFPQTAHLEVVMSLRRR